MDTTDRAIINSLQGGFPITERPYAQVAQGLGISEQTLIERIERLLQDKYLSRFGPMYHAEQLGGALSLVAMRVPEAEFERVADIVNSYPEVAHNYARDHALNMWFVLATETPERIQEVLADIEARSGHPTFNMPKEAEFFVGLRFEA